MGHIPHWRKQFKSINTYGLREGKTHYLFYKNIIVLHLNKLGSTSPKDALCQVWLKLVLKKILLISCHPIVKFCQCNFCHFIIIPPWKRAKRFIWTNFNPLHPGILCAKFCCNWPSGSGEEDFFLILSMYFQYLVIIFPWKRLGPSFEQTWVLITQECFVPNLVEIGPEVQEKKNFLISSKYFRYLVIIFPWKRPSAQVS
mgnify:CR=1 FL=1